MVLFLLKEINGNIFDFEFSSKKNTSLKSPEAEAVFLENGMLYITNKLS